jgi:hypothetical protein
MHLALVAMLALAGCPSRSSLSPPGDGLDAGIGIAGGCKQDSDCSSPGSVDAGSNILCAPGPDCDLVCAGDGVCVSAAEVTTVHVKWTLQGQAASAATCTGAPSLAVFFSSSTSASFYGDSPVACAEGELTVAKLEDYYDEVALYSVDAEWQLGSGSNASISFDGSSAGTVTLDLPY